MGYPQTNRKTDTGKTLKPWPVLVDHFTDSYLVTELILLMLITRQEQRSGLI
ncbi:hypothetical protein A0V81_001077 [Salmonella enterica subsp. enterica serovar Newmexico]|nr:hypothetical protein [Salmonella enterica subsp. enterica serovar Newmexico]EDV6678815.1 hypothetical protein [Salmonella enterica subsp. enterica serovar Newmexico]EDX2436234.1 hypothetical protein [Salmonella enterica subsp. enterica serovar Koenigstuhl]